MECGAHVIGMCLGKYTSGANFNKKILRVENKAKGDCFGCVFIYNQLLDQLLI